MQYGELPGGVVLQRTTDELDAESVPKGLLRAHHLAKGVWGLLQLRGGSLTFVWEDDPDHPIELAAGDALVIRPEVLHHAEPAADARFVIAFYR